MKLLLPIFLLFACAQLWSADSRKEKESGEKTIAVRVVGEVKKPGEYRVPEGSTVWFAIERAGGREVGGFGPSPVRVSRKQKDGTELIYAIDDGKNTGKRDAFVLQDSDVISLLTVL